MFCKNCGTQLEDNAQFCSNCGTNLQAPTQDAQPAPQQPQAAQPAPQQTPAQPFNLASIKQYNPFIAVGMAAIALIFGIITLFNLFDVTATVKVGSYESSGSGSISDILEMDGMGMALVGNILFGIILIAVAAVGGLFFAKRFGVNVYDSLKSVPFLTEESPVFFMGALGAIGAVLHFVCYLFAGSSESAYGMTASYSVCAPWFTWVILIVFAGVAAFDKFVLNKKQ